MGKTKIEWADYTFNPWIGCTHVSEGCKHCYAERQDVQYQWTENGWGAGKPRRRTGRGYWKKAYTWNRKARVGKTRYKVFCGSLMDVFDDEVPQRWRDALWTTMLDTTLLDWQLLTKRPQNILEMIPDDWHTHWPDNVWVGISAENQKRLNERAPYLIEVPARIHFLSLEPLLGEIDFVKTAYSINRIGGKGIGGLTLSGLMYWLDWVIVGAESGRYARPMKEEWVRSIVRQCKEAEVPVFYKQSLVNGEKTSLPLLDGKQYAEFPEEL